MNSNDALWNTLEYKAVVSVDVCSTKRESPPISQCCQAARLIVLGDGHQPLFEELWQLCWPWRWAWLQPWAHLHQEVISELHPVSVRWSGLWGLRGAISVVTTAPPHMEKGFLENKVFLAFLTVLQQLGGRRGQTSIGKIFSGFTYSWFEHTGSLPKLWVYQVPAVLQRLCLWPLVQDIRLCAVVELRLMYSRIRNWLDMSWLLSSEGWLSAANKAEEKTF